MGRDKATIEFDGQPLWTRQIETLRALGSQRILVSARTKPSWLPDDVELLLDDSPSRGPLSGLTKALAALRTTHLVALAIDMPFMTGEQLGRISSLAQIGYGVVPIIHDRAEPLAAVYPAEVSPAFAEALAGADSSLQTLVRKLAAEDKIRLLSVATRDEHLYRNVNEPNDFKEGRFPNRPPE
jgi:molybdopterin-guanine dinucleotide biosynthesis protein A